MMEHRCDSVAWKPSPVVALSTSADHSQVAAARDDGSLEIWLVSPGSVGWHCQLTIHGDPNSRVSSLVWCRAGQSGLPSGRLFSSSIDGSVSEWDLFDLKQKTALESIGVSIWQMAVAPISIPLVGAEPSARHIENGYRSEKSDDSGDEEEISETENDSDSEDAQSHLVNADKCVAIACDDGCVRMYIISDSDKLTYHRSLPRVSGRALSVAWSPDARMIYSGSSDGFIRCWDFNHCNEIYRITVGLGGFGNGSELCVWSLLSLRCGTLVSGDSSGSVQFWDSKHGTLLQAHSNHKGDVNALAVAPSHNRVFSAGSDGQVILYQLSSEALGSNDDKLDVDSNLDKSSSAVVQNWVYIGYVRAHTHDIRALTVAVPICREDHHLDEAVADTSIKRACRKDRRKQKPVDFTYHKWAHLGVPMLISAGDDAKLFAYTVQEFTKFSPHDICPAPQRVPIQMVHKTIFNQTSLLLVQGICSLDILRIHISNDLGGRATTKSLVHVKSKDSRKIICSAISNSGSFFAYSDQASPSLFELKRNEFAKCPWSVNRRRLPKLPFAHSMIFSSDCSQLMIAGCDRRIYTVDVSSLELVHTFTPCREEQEDDPQPSEPPITKLFTSSDGQWLAAVNCFGDVYVFNLELQRQHWFISRLDGASVAAAGFHPRNTNVLVISTSSNQIFAFDVEAKQLGQWSIRNTYILPKRYQEFPGEVFGLSFSPPSSSSSVIIYSPRAKCVIDFGMPLDRDDETDVMNANVSKKLEGIYGNDGLKFGNKTRKRRLEDHHTESKSIAPSSKNFEIIPSKHPVLFVGHLSKNSILVIEKPWIEVVKGLDTKPVHRPIFGT